jgi:DNA-binding protein H-NS
MAKSDITAIQTQIAKLQKALDKAQSKREPAIRKVKALMEKLGVSLDDLKGSAAAAPRRGRKPGSAKAKSTGTVAIKYQDGNGNTWTGRGKTPRWLVEAEANGQSRTQFLIG